MDASSDSRPRAFRLQFSLRVLLIALTAFAVGFPIWYRWPYQEVLEERDPVTGAVTSRRIMTRQRQWGGDSLPHGKQEDHQFWGGNEMVITTHYVRGNRHGPYSICSSTGSTSTTGQYADDMREGLWTVEFDQVKTTSNYHRDKIDGVLTIGASSRIRQAATTATFNAGKLTSFDGQPVQDHLPGILESGAVDERIAMELGKSTEVDFAETPLKDTIDYLKDKHNLPIVLDVKCVPNADLPITAAFGGIDLGPTLTLLTAPHGLACDYRYGALWVTTAEDARNWHDPTGVAAIKPSKGTALEQWWNEPAPTLDIVNASLAQVLDAIERETAIGMDWSRIETTGGPGSPSVTIQMSAGLPYQHVLGQLLYLARCRCKLEGDRLVILPPE